MARIKSIGAQIDAVFKQRERYRLLQKKADDAEKKLNEMKEAVIAECHRQKLDGAKGALATVTVKKEIKASPVDWEAFHEFVYKEKAAWMYFARIKDSAFRLK